MKYYVKPGTLTWRLMWEKLSHHYMNRNTTSDGLSTGNEWLYAGSIDNSHYFEHNHTSGSDGKVLVEIVIEGSYDAGFGKKVEEIIERIANLVTELQKKNR